MLSIFLCTLRTGVHCRSLTLRLERVVTRRFSRLLWREVGIVGRCTLRAGVHCRSLTLHLGRVVTRRFSRLLWREVGIIGRCTLRAGVHCRSLTLHLGRVVTRRLSRLLRGESVFVWHAEDGRTLSVAYASPGNALLRVGSHACSGGRSKFL